MVVDCKSGITHSTMIGQVNLLDALLPARHHTPMLIYKIFRQNEWDAFRQSGQTQGAPVDLTDGYIHFSTREQASETATKHFAGEHGLMLLAVETEALGDALKWQTSRGGALFPHLYTALDMDDVVWALPLPLEQGAHRFPVEAV